MPTMTIISNLKQQSDYYDYHRRTVPQFIADARRRGLGPTLKDRLMWDRMRMSPTDISDVTGATYTFLLNGTPPAANWTGLFNPGKRIRLRFINGSSMTTFDVRIPGLPLTVVAADGSDVAPVTVGEFRSASPRPTTSSSHPHASPRAANIATPRKYTVSITELSGISQGAVQQDHPSMPQGALAQLRLVSSRPQTTSVTA